MAGFNNVVLMGNLTRDPELRHTPAGTAIAAMGLAINSKWRDKDDQLREETTFVEMTAFGKTADTAARYLKKGEPVLIGGRLKYHTWESKDGTGKRHKLDVVVDDLRLLPRRGGGGGDFGAGPGGHGPGGHGAGGHGAGGHGPGEFLADAATAFEDADDSADPFGAPEQGGMPSGRN